MKFLHAVTSLVVQTEYKHLYDHGRYSPRQPVCSDCRSCFATHSASRVLHKQSPQLLAMPMRQHHQHNIHVSVVPFRIVGCLLMGRLLPIPQHGVACQQCLASQQQHPLLLVQLSNFRLLPLLAHQLQFEEYCQRLSLSLRDELHWRRGYGRFPCS